MKKLKLNRISSALNGESFDAKTAVFVSLVSFVLFWGGVLTPLLTENVAVYAFSLIPFYVFFVVLDVFASRPVGNRFKSKSIFIGSGMAALFALASSFLGLVSFANFMNISGEFLYATRIMLAINVVPSIGLLFYTVFNKALFDVDPNVDLYVATSS